jgi:para-aminobenzoate synthetase component 1
MLEHDLPYDHDTAQLFGSLAHDDWAMLLDSGQTLNPQTGLPGSQYGRYDIIVAEPFATLVTRDGETTVTHLGHQKISKQNPFLLLRDLLGQYPAAKADTIFAGGAVGYWGYDLTRTEAQLPSRPQAVPEMMVGLYDWAILTDHRTKTCKLVSHGLLPQTRANFDALKARLDAVSRGGHEKPFVVRGETASNFTRAGYHQAVETIHQYIRAGDCYQVNLSQRFQVPVEGDAWTAYLKLREISPAPFMAFMQLPDAKGQQFQILSNSPERFLQTDGEHVETRPIKGTRPRDSDPIVDAANASELQDSRKDRAENLMIVDLLRNDIGKVCRIGSVRADTLFQLQSFANVHHLVSIVTGKLKVTATAVNLLQACFPGGSITGAPKLRAMQIIDELEPDARGIYCGAIGYIGFDGQMDTNIAIRTAVVQNGDFTYYAGGGVVVDSMPESEYQETLNKATSMEKCLSAFSK